MQRLLRALFLFSVFIFLSGVVVASDAIAEKEPNNTPAHANNLTAYAPVEGAIEPVGDVDYFRVKGSNAFWGMVALLDTNGSTASQNGVLTAYAPDGVTVLQRDESGPGKKAVVAWVHFTGSNDHFLRVNEAGDNQRVSHYSLRYYKLSIGIPNNEHSEQEPNDTPATANTSARVNKGTIGRPGGMDCYAIYAKPGQKFMFVLNADPEGDGGPADFVLDLYKNDGTLWASADRAGPGSNEYIDEQVIPEKDVYTYCVRAKSGAGPHATYLSGPIRDGRGYEPSFQFNLHWDNPRPGNFARVGDEMRYTLTFTHTSPLTVPGPFRLYVYFKPACQSVVDNDHADHQNTESFEWRYSDLPAHMAVTKTITMRAEASCYDNIGFDVSSDYYDTGWGKALYYIIGQGIYFPLMMR